MTFLTAAYSGRSRTEEILVISIDRDYYWVLF